MSVTSRVLRGGGLTAVALGLTIGCASPFPAVVTSTSEKVAIEFEKDGSLEDASALAQKECAKFGKQADFDAVDVHATPGTRIARFHCVAPAPTADAPAPAPAPAPASTPAEPATGEAAMPEAEPAP